MRTHKSLWLIGFVKTEVPITSIREVRDSDVSDDKVDEIIREALHNAVHPEIFD